MKKTITKELSEDQLAILNESYPVSGESNRLSLPRFGMLSKDIVEESGTGKNKKIKVVQAAGTFFTEKDEGEIDEDGKSVWTRNYIESENVEVIISFHRWQLRKYDSSLEKFISSPIYDTPEQVLPLYLDKQVIQRGTEAQLQALYPALTQKGKKSSDLKKDIVLYVVYNGELYQAHLSQSSKWSFLTYRRTLNPSTVVTTLGSVEETFGKNTYRKMTFTKGRQINPDEFEIVTENQGKLKEVVQSDERLFLASGDGNSEAEADKELDDIVEKF
jgi:hypothetical protein